MPRPRTLALALGVTLACDRRGGGKVAVYPDALAFDHAPHFVGSWSGTAAGVQGRLTIGELDELRYSGQFEGNGSSVRYILLMDQSLAASESHGAVPSNRVVFTWQDGAGGRGKGWLLINREGTRLTGSSGYVSATEGHGQWALERR